MSEPSAVKRVCDAPTTGMIEYPGEEAVVRRFREFLSVRSVSVTSLEAPGQQPDYGKTTVASYSAGFSDWRLVVTVCMCNLRGPTDMFNSVQVL